MVFRNAARAAGAALTLALALAGGGAAAQPPGQSVAEEGPLARRAPGGGSNGEALFKQHCAQCHDPAVGRAPDKAALTQNFPETVKRALTLGVMQPMADGIPDADLDAIVLYLTGRVPKAAGSTTNEDRNRCPANARFNPKGPQWNGWSNDVEMTRHQPKAGLKAADVPRLKVKWAFAIDGARYGQPSPYGNRVFVGSSSGRVYSLDTKSGCVAWMFDTTIGVRAAPSVVKNPKAPSGYAVMVGDMGRVVHALDAQSGQELWKTRVEDHPRGLITGSPVVSGGVIFVPMAIWEEATAGVAAYPCCTGRGSLTAVDLATGKVLWKFYTIAAEPKPRGRRNAAGTQMYGPAGATIWSAPSVDVKRGLVYVATGDSFTEIDDGGASDSVFALDIKTGKARWHTQVQTGDNYVNGCGPGRASNPVNCPSEPIGPDFDFGAAPILVHAKGGDVLTAGQKSGIVYGFNPDTGAILWKTKVSAGSALGGIEWGMTADKHTVYAAAADRQGGLTALDIRTGTPRWSVKIENPKCSWQGRCAGGYSAPPSMIPGVVFAGSQDGHIRAFEAAGGKKIWDFDTAGQTYATANGYPTQRGGQLDGNGPTIAGGQVYMMSGYNGSGGGGWSDNVLLVFSVDGK